MHKTIPKDAILIPDKAKRVFKGIVYDVYHWKQKRFDGSLATFEMLKRQDTVAVIGVVGESIVVLRDEQPHRGQKITFPGGRADDQDEDSLSAARRETLEESGYEFAHWCLVDVVQPQVKLEWFVHLYLAWGATRQQEAQKDAGERVAVDLKSFQEVKRLTEQTVGYLGLNRQFFERFNSLEELLQAPEFHGQEVDR